MKSFTIWIKNIFLNILFISLIILFIIIINNTNKDSYKKIDTNTIEYNNTFGYIGYLIIDKINMRLGFYDLNDARNNVNQNIEVLPSSTEGRLFIAGHSGIGKVSFFNDLRYLKKDDEIKIVYQNNIYKYKVTNIYKEIKDGNINVKIKDKEKVLVLTTCDQITKGYQLIIKAILI